MAATAHAACITGGPTATSHLYAPLEVKGNKRSRAQAGGFGGARSEVRFLWHTEYESPFS